MCVCLSLSITLVTTHRHTEESHYPNTNKKKKKRVHWLGRCCCWLLRCCGELVCTVPWLVSILVCACSCNQPILCFSDTHTHTRTHTHTHSLARSILPSLVSFRPFSPPLISSASLLLFLLRWVASAAGPAHPLLSPLTSPHQNMQDSSTPASRCSLASTGAGPEHQVDACQPN